MTSYGPGRVGSHRTGSDWTRDQWLAYADRLLDGAQAWASPSGALITPPGAEGGYGRAVDGLEGFARTFLLAGFRLAGAQGEGLDELAERYARGITAGVDRSSPEAWVRLTEHPQAKVEAASLALILDMTRPWIWDRLDATTQERVVDYLAPVVGDDTYPQTNWVWFRTVVQTFLRSVGGPWSADDIAADLARHDSFVRADGWLADGEERSFDHYNGWALHTYPVLWSRMTGAADLAGDRTTADVARLDRFLLDAVALVGGDGSPLQQGRSLIYRFAAAAPFWVGAMAGVPSLEAGQLRHAADRVVGHFAAHGVPDERDLLSMGWYSEWRRLAQSYSGPGSPYWAAKGLLGVALPEGHPVWSAPSVPLPVDERDDLRAVRAAGWLVSGTRADGIVRVVNHGTDHDDEGVLVGDSPLYTRLGYSTATPPVLDDRAWTDPVEQSVALVDRDGAATHRAGMTLLGVEVADGVGVAASTWDAHLLEPDHGRQRHGSGLAGAVDVAGRVTTHSLVRGPWELRLAQVESLAEGRREADLRLRIGGWPVAGAAPAGRVEDDAAVAVADGLTSRLVAVRGNGAPALDTRVDATPLGTAVIPTLEFPVAVGDWVAVLVELTGADVPRSHRARVEITDQHLRSVTVTWPDGHTTSSNLHHRTAPAAR
ncbi:hypothetical protein SAMN04487968_105267 [Nocardioides terrae]|uniref:DUF2264 domain-containing protein n=1 Tax=Nocardioides terrae TaxID=574651 RepID=A0A1I1IF64_9ACTN|nr:DUF2264 domain-containing protein [Nocardioides terrae]SFC34805.1 hypothetical protein SAMN04487968_105267 [Nocardioides terrae]